MKEQTAVSHGGTGFLVRLYWMFLGNALLAFLLISIFQKHPKLPSLLDAAYWGALASLIAVRYVDVRFLNGETGDGKLATFAHWRRYATVLALVGAGAWLLIRALLHLMK